MITVIISNLILYINAYITAYYNMQHILYINLYMIYNVYYKCTVNELLARYSSFDSQDV